ncbi:MAG: hypothetical protein JST67_05335 [Bacteroidetes bacterium]|nr:hypothetical protein [Bacteroidota bacterium]
MKKTILFFLSVISLHAFSQDSTRLKQRFSLGVGPSWASLCWGANANLSYALSKKFNVKVRGVLTAGKMDYSQTSYDNFISYSGNTIFDLSATANYFIIGNTKPDCKAALYVGLGLGYLRVSNTSTYILIYNGPGGLYYGAGYSSGQEKSVSQSVSATTGLGALFKLGPGKIYIESYISVGFAGAYTGYDYFLNNQIPPQFQQNTYSDKFGAGLFGGILCANVGYAVPF